MWGGVTVLPSFHEQSLRLSLVMTSICRAFGGTLERRARRSATAVRPRGDDLSLRAHPPTSIVVEAVSPFRRPPVETLMTAPITTRGPYRSAARLGSTSESFDGRLDFPSANPPQPTDPANTVHRTVARKTGHFASDSCWWHQSIGRGTGIPAKHHLTPTKPHEPVHDKPTPLVAVRPNLPATGTHGRHQFDLIAVCDRALHG